MPANISKERPHDAASRASASSGHLQEHGETMFQKWRFWANGARQVYLGGLFALMSVGLGPPGQTWRDTVGDESGNTEKTNEKTTAFRVLPRVRAGAGGVPGGGSCNIIG